MFGVVNVSLMLVNLVLELPFFPQFFEPNFVIIKKKFPFIHEKFFLFSFIFSSLLSLLFFQVSLCFLIIRLPHMFLHYIPSTVKFITINMVKTSFLSLNSLLRDNGTFLNTYHEVLEYLIII